MNDYNFPAQAIAITQDRQSRLLAISQVNQQLSQHGLPSHSMRLSDQIYHHVGDMLIGWGQRLKTGRATEPMAYA